MATKKKPAPKNKKPTPRTNPIPTMANPELQGVANAIAGLKGTGTAAVQGAISSLPFAEQIYQLTKSNKLDETVDPGLTRSVDAATRALEEAYKTDPQVDAALSSLSGFANGLTLSPEQLRAIQAGEEAFRVAKEGTAEQQAAAERYLSELDGPTLGYLNEIGAKGYGEAGLNAQRELALENTFKQNAIDRQNLAARMGAAGNRGGGLAAGLNAIQNRAAVDQARVNSELIARDADLRLNALTQAGGLSNNLLTGLSTIGNQKADNATSAATGLGQTVNSAQANLNATKGSAFSALADATIQNNATRGTNINNAVQNVTSSSASAAEDAYKKKATNFEQMNSAIANLSSIPMQYAGIASNYSSQQEANKIQREALKSARGLSSGSSRSGSSRPRGDGRDRKNAITPTTGTSF